jgi:cytidine deaminase
MLREPMPAADSDLLDRLRTAARQAEVMNWTPYTRFPVLAAVRTVDGNFFGGSNVENANISLSKHAEETAILAALANGALLEADRSKRRRCIDALYTTAPPCGSCRQFLWEFATDDCVVYIEAHGSDSGVHLLKDLLPNAFGPEHQGIDGEANDA